MALAVRDAGKAGQVAFVVQQQVHLGGPLGGLVLGPVEQRSAQIDAGRVQTHQLILEAELLFPLGLGHADPQQLLEYRLVQLPRPMLVGIRQGALVRCRLDSQVLQLAFELAISPLQISRNDFACPSLQNSIVTSCPQHVNPRACRSALCCTTASWNFPRGNNCNNCAEMLHTRFMAELSCKLDLDSETQFNLTGRSART